MCFRKLVELVWIHLQVNTNLKGNFLCVHVAAKAFFRVNWDLLGKLECENLVVKYAAQDSEKLLEIISRTRGGQVEWIWKTWRFWLWEVWKFYVRHTIAVALLLELSDTFVRLPWFVALSVRPRCWNRWSTWNRWVASEKFQNCNVRWSSDQE